MDGPGAVYYDFSGHHIDGGQTQQPPPPPQPGPAPRQCSVRGCTLFVTYGQNNKMCDACRGRHRIYATTKRARRKLEKAAVANSALAGGSALALIHESNSAIIVEKDDAVPNMWMGNGQIIMEQGSSMGHSQIMPHQDASSSYWDQDLDPMLKEGIQTVVQPHQRSRDSELAHALTYAPPPVHMHAERPPFAPAEPETMAGPSDLQYPQEQSPTLVALNQDQDDAKETGEPTRECSVKGCKAHIAVSYEFKMCPQCRVRYRSYGTTKRAKWKHERESFQKEMEGLRMIEDEKRKAKGLRPLSDNPEELRAWELSVIDEQVPLPAVDNLGSLGSLAGAMSVGMQAPEASTQQPIIDASISSATTTFSQAMQQLPPGDAFAASGSTSIDTTTNSVSPYLHHPSVVGAAATAAYPGSSDSPLVSAAPLPARMCTVSHCHKILPGFYRYKRCEQHRLQNRYHSQLKRVREKEGKAAGGLNSNFVLQQAMDGSSEMTEGSSAMGGSGVDQCVVKAMRDRRLKMLRKRKKAQPTKKAKSSAFVDGQGVPTEHLDAGVPRAGSATGEVPIWGLAVGEDQNQHEGEFVGHDADHNQAGTSASTQHQSAGSQGPGQHSFFVNMDGKQHANPATVRRRQYENLSKFSCASIDCHNLLTPGIRWRMCEDCRAIERQRRTNERRVMEGLVSPAGDFIVAEDANQGQAAQQQQDGMGSVQEQGQAVTATPGANGLPENKEHGPGVDAGTDSQSDADADAEGDEDGEGEADVAQPAEVPHASSAQVASEQANPGQGRPLIWKTNAPDDSAPWASGFSKFRVEKPRPASKNQSSTKTVKAKPLPTANDAAGSSQQANIASEQSADHDSSAPLATSIPPTSEDPPSVEQSSQTVAGSDGPEALSSKARGKRKASEETVNSNSAPPPPIPVASSSYSAPYGYPSSYPYYSYYTPSYPMPPYPYTPAVGGPGGPPGGPPGYSPYPYHSSPSHSHSHPHPQAPPPPPHSQPYGYPPPSGYPYLPPRYPAWGQTQQVPYGGYQPPPPPNSGPTPYPYYTQASYPPPPPHVPTMNVPTFNHYQPKPDPPPSTAAKKKRAKTSNQGTSSAQASETQTIPAPSEQAQDHDRPAFTPGSTVLPIGSVEASKAASPIQVDQPSTAGQDGPVNDDATSEDTRHCTTCKRSLASTSQGTLCDKCRTRFKKHQIKAKQKFKLEPRKFLRDVKPSTSQAPGDSEEATVS